MLHETSYFTFFVDPTPIKDEHAKNDFTLSPPSITLGYYVIAASP